ncbi:MAG: PilW family protein [Gammaproteobacteria bacterium]|jgi:type IV pilus assembly protein PilW|nr:PilW family protein [Gammaproteobacteria bacterium]
MKLNKHQLGISMVEVLVALVISVFLLGGIIQIYVGNKATYGFTDAISRIQENGRFALDTMTTDLRMAGFFGCAVFDPDDTENIVNNLNPASPDYDPNIHDFILAGVINGTENDGLNGSDSVTLRGSKPNQVNVHPPYNVSTSAMIHVTANNAIKPGDIVMVANCRGADIFQVTNTTTSTNASQNAVVHNTGGGSPGNYNTDSCKGGNAHCLSQTYGSDAAMFEMQTVTYSIQTGDGGEPALFRSENGTDIELIDGIEQMQILYGLDTDGDKHANRYVTIDNVPDTFDVMAVRLMLLVRSRKDFVAEDNQKYIFNGANVTAGDRRLRQVFMTTIALRNRVGS